MKLRLLFVPLVALLLAGCNEGGAVGPNPFPTAPIGGSVGTSSLTFVDGGTGAPASGASVAVSGRQIATTDTDGKVTIEPPAEVGTLFDAVLDSKFLPRNTLIRSLTESVTLWPVSSSSPAEFFQELVFNEFVPRRRLSRPVVSAVYLRLSPEIANDPEASEVHRQAAAVLTAAAGISYIVSDNPPTGASVYDMVVDSSQQYIGLTYNRFSGNRITGEKVSYKYMVNARNLTAVAHELGHTLGLGHTSQRTLMNLGSTGTGATDFSEAEKLAIKMMFQRYPGTQWPDNDRNSQAMSGFRGTIVIACGEPQ